MKTETSALELHHLMMEMQDLIGAKVDKIYLDKKRMLLQLHKTGSGKNMLYIQAPSFFYIISKKPEFPERPPSFCMQLRKNLDQSRIKSIEQLGFERIVKIIFSTKDKEFTIYIELFQPGNIVFTNTDDKILGLSESMNVADRTLRPGAIYKLPPKKTNTKSLSEPDFEKIITSSDKESIVKTLAIDLSLGGLYAEELCLASGVDKTKKDITSADIKKLFLNLKKMLEKNKEAYLYEKKEITPIKIQKYVDHDIFGNFSEAIDSVITPMFEFKKINEEETKHDKQMEKSNLILSEQQQHLKKLQKDIEENQKIGELIYTNYSEIKSSLDQFRIDQKKMSQKDLKEKYKNHPIIKEIKEKEGTIIIDV